MARFRGRYDYSIDAKGRINIPAKFRKALSPEARETFVICRAPDNCLRAYPQNIWDKYEDELASRPQTPQALRHQRLLYNSLSDSSLDSQGRIALGAAQIELAQISKSVTLVGQNGYIEIWDTSRYDEYMSSQDDFDTVFFQSVESGLKQ